VLWAQGCQDSAEDGYFSPGGRHHSPHLKVTCSPPCSSSRCCWGCNIWPQSTRGSRSSILLQVASGALMRAHLLDAGPGTKKQTPTRTDYLELTAHTETGSSSDTYHRRVHTCHTPRTSPFLSFHSFHLGFSLLGALHHCVTSLSTPQPSCVLCPASRDPESAVRSGGLAASSHLPALSGPHAPLHHSLSLSAHCAPVSRVCQTWLQLHGLGPQLLFAKKAATAVCGSCTEPG
jgi:hypothetical protein